MKVLRATVFPRPVKGSFPLTTVVRDIDMTESLEAIRDYAEALDRTSLVVSDLFELPDDTDIVAATLAAERRVRKDVERNMATLFHWDAMTLEVTRPTSVISPTLPAPLGEEDAGVTLEALAEHPGYKGHAVVVICEDWTILAMRHGKIGKLRSGVRTLLEGAAEKIIPSSMATPKDEALIREIDLVLGTTN